MQSPDVTSDWFWWNWAKPRLRKTREKRHLLYPQGRLVILAKRLQRNPKQLSATPTLSGKPSKTKRDQNKSTEQPKKKTRVKNEDKQNHARSSPQYRNPVHIHFKFFFIRQQSLVPPRFHIRFRFNYAAVQIQLN